MSNLTAKDTTIKFNVSPKFKRLAQVKAEEVGFSLSDLGRFLFGAYLHGDILTPKKNSLDSLVEEGIDNYKSGKTTTVKNLKDLKSHLSSLK